MTYVKKYHAYFSSPSYGGVSQEYLIEWLFDGFVGTSTEVKVSSVKSTPKDSSDQVSGVKAYQLSVDILTATLRSSAFFAATEKSIQVVLKNVTNPLSIGTEYVGYVTAENSKDPYIDGSRYLQINHNDGLELLKQSSFTDSSGGRLAGKESIVKVLAKCFTKSGFDLNINTLIDVFQAGDFVDATTPSIVNKKIYQELFEGETCYGILEKVAVTLNSYIVQQNGEWWLVHPESVSGTGFHHKFSGSGDFVSGSTFATTAAVGFNQNDRPLSGGEVSSERPYGKIVSELALSGSINALTNNDFQLVTAGVPDGWTLVGIDSFEKGGTGTTKDPFYGRLNGYSPAQNTGGILNRLLSTGEIYRTYQLFDETSGVDSETALNQRLSFDVKVKGNDVREAFVNVVAILSFANNIAILFSLSDSGEWVRVSTDQLPASQGMSVKLANSEGISKTEYATVSIESKPISSVFGQKKRLIFVVTDIISKVNKKEAKDVVALNVVISLSEGYRQTAAPTNVNYDEWVQYSGLSVGFANNEVTQGAKKLRFTTNLQSDSSRSKEVVRLFSDNADGAEKSGIFNNNGSANSNPWRSSDIATGYELSQLFDIELLQRYRTQLQLFDSEIIGKIGKVNQFSLFGYTNKFVPVRVGFDYTTGITKVYALQKSGVLFENFDNKKEAIFSDGTAVEMDKEVPDSVIRDSEYRSKNPAPFDYEFPDYAVFTRSVNIMADGNDGPIGISLFDTAGDETDYIRKVPTGFIFKSESSDHKATLDFSNLTADVALKVPALAVASTIATDATAWMRGATNVLTSKDFIGSASGNFDIGIKRNGVEIATAKSTGVDVVGKVTAATVNSTSLTTNYITKSGAGGLLSDSQIFDNGTNVGINANPVASDKFQIYGGGFNLGVYRDLDFNLVGPAASFLSVGQIVNAIPTPAFDLIGLSITETDGQFRLRVRNANVMTEYIRVLSSGTIGFGTPAPLAGTRIDVNGITRTTNLRITNNAAVGKVWQCNNVDGSGVWTTPLASERYIAEWNAGSGVAPSTSPTEGDYYRVNGAGTYAGVTYASGDDTYWNGSAWLLRKNYLTLPKATDSILGGIKIGATLEIDTSGIVNQKTGVVTAGDYQNVTVDTYGRVTGGTNPTTIAGYGITDAYTKSESSDRYSQLSESNTLSGINTFEALTIFQDNSIFQSDITYGGRLKASGGAGSEKQVLTVISVSFGLADRWATLDASYISDFSTTVRTSISETVTGLDYNNSTGILSLTSGYIIPTIISLGLKYDAADFSNDWDVKYNLIENNLWTVGATNVLTAKDFIGSASGNFDIGIKRNGVEVLTAKSTGIDVVGKLTAATVNASSLIQNVVVKSGAAGLLSNSQIFDNGTNVGIGTATPSLDKLQILGSGFNLGVYRNAEFTTIDSAASIISVGQLVNSVPTPAFDLIGLSISAVDGQFRLRVRSANVMSEVIRVLAGGNVGIGTTTPSHLLHVNGTARSNKLLINTAIDNGSAAQVTGSISYTETLRPNNIAPTTGQFLKATSATANTWASLAASDISNFVSTVRTSISETVTGLDYNNSTGVLSLTSGYVIPTTTAFGAKAEASNVYTKNASDSRFEPAFNKNTAFNKNFGTTAGTVAEGNHVHTFASLTSKPTTIGGYGITDYNSLWDAKMATFIDTAPEALDTWIELVTEIQDNDSQIANLFTQIAAKQNKFTQNGFVKLSSNGATVNYLTTLAMSDISGLENSLNLLEPKFSKNTAFNKNFGTSSGTVAQGNDSRINNGQTAFGYGNHANAGYLTENFFEHQFSDGSGGVRNEYGLRFYDTNNLEKGRLTYDIENELVGFATTHVDESGSAFTMRNVFDDAGRLVQINGSGDARAYAFSDEIQSSGGSTTPGLQEVATIDPLTRIRIKYNEGTATSVAAYDFALVSDTQRLRYRANGQDIQNYALMSDLAGLGGSATPNLQSVTNEGARTTNDIILKNVSDANLTGLSFENSSGVAQASFVFYQATNADKFEVKSLRGLDLIGSLAVNIKSIGSNMLLETPTDLRLNANTIDLNAPYLFINVLAENLNDAYGSRYAIEKINIGTTQYPNIRYQWVKIN